MMMMTDPTTPVAATPTDKMHKLPVAQEQQPSPQECAAAALATGGGSSAAYPGGSGGGGCGGTSGPRVSFNRDVHVKRFGG